MLNRLAFTALPVQSRLACDRRADRRPASQADRQPGRSWWFTTTAVCGSEQSRWRFA